MMRFCVLAVVDFTHADGVRRSVKCYLVAGGETCPDRFGINAIVKERQLVVLHFSDVRPCPRFHALAPDKGKINGGAVGSYAIRVRAGSVFKRCRVTKDYAWYRLHTLTPRNESPVKVR